MRITALAIFFLSTGVAQQTVAPSPEAAGKPRGQNTAEYNIVNNFETGYRFASIDGNRGKYRSDVNFRNGLRLLSSNLTIHSREGAGRFFDELVLNTQGLGNDPYQSAGLRIRKNRLFNYDLLWRQNEYFNPALPISFGQHGMDTVRRLQDHDLTLFPQSAVRFFFGYSRVNQSGPALSTIQLFDSRGDEFPLFSNIRRQRNEFRIGNEIRAFGFRLNWMRGWDNFKEDTPFNLSAPNAGNNPSDRTTLTSLRRDEPYHGNSPYWRVVLMRDGKSRYDVNGRFTYTAGRRAFVLDELAVGTARFGALNRQVLTYGNANRPVATGNLTVSLFPTSDLTITNHTSLYNVRIDGNSYFRTLENGTLATDFLNFQYLGIRTAANETQVNLRLNPVLALFAGYNYSNRRIGSADATAVPPTGLNAPRTEQTNELHSGVAGIRIRPIKPLVVVVDAEIGRNSRPIFPTSDRNYHLLGARLHYKVRTLSFSALARSNYNSNSISLSAFASRTRNYSGDFSWTPRDWLSFDLSYSKLHLDTVGGIAYFAGGDFVEGERSVFISNIHHGNAGVRFNFRRRADLFIGFSRIQDTGDGRSAAAGRGLYSALPAFQAAQTFPLTFQSPSARFSVRLQERLRFNVGYQYYGYSEDFPLPTSPAGTQNYRANTGYSSLSWSF